MFSSPACVTTTTPGLARHTSSSVLTRLSGQELFEVRFFSLLEKVVLRLQSTANYLAWGDAQL